MLSNPRTEARVIIFLALFSPVWIESASVSCAVVVCGVIYTMNDSGTADKKKKVIPVHPVIPSNMTTIMIIMMPLLFPVCREFCLFICKSAVRFLIALTGNKSSEYFADKIPKKYLQVQIFDLSLHRI